jgi:hypothetical protein
MAGTLVAERITARNATLATGSSDQLLVDPPVIHGKLRVSITRLKSSRLMFLVLLHSRKEMSFVCKLANSDERRTWMENSTDFG